jgi:hypothetical protein
VRLLFQDEARFGRISDLRRCWAPWPLRPVVGQQIIREFVYGLAAVRPFDGELCSLVLPWVDTATLSLFLAHTAACFPNDHCLMLLDGAGWHTAAALQVPPNLHLLPLPPLQPRTQPRGAHLGPPAGKLYGEPRLFLSARRSQSALRRPPLLTPTPRGRPLHDLLRLVQYSIFDSELVLGTLETQ